MRLQKVGADQTVEYPVPYCVWEKAPGFAASIPETATKKEALKRVTLEDWEANPVNGGNSPWAILPKKRFCHMANIRGRSDWLAGRKGVTTDLNGVYMVRILDTNKKDSLVQIETRPEAGKADIGPARKFWVEPDLLYPLLKGAGDFSACHLCLKSDLYVFVPNDGISSAHYVAAIKRLAKLKKTVAYFKSFKALLEKRSTYRLRQKSAPYCVIYNVGTYTFAPYKVVWAELSTKFEAAVIQNSNVPLVGCRQFVPDHKVYFVDFDDADTAYFVCALLNSSLVREYVESHTIHIQVSNIFKYLALPRYDPDNKHHVTIVELCRKTSLSEFREVKENKLLELSELSEKLLLEG